MTRRRRRATSSTSSRRAAASASRNAPITWPASATSPREAARRGSTASRIAGSRNIPGGRCDGGRKSCRDLSFRSYRASSRHPSEWRCPSGHLDFARCERGPGFGGFAMTDFLLELRSEEIPARMQAGARAELDKLFRAQLAAAGLEAGDLTIWSTPRRRSEEQTSELQPLRRISYADFCLKKKKKTMTT